MLHFTEDDFKKRLDKIIRRLPEHKLDAFLIEDPINLYYLTGLDLTAGRLLIDRKSATLFVDGRYSEIAKLNSPFPVSAESDLDVGVISELAETKRKSQKIGFLSNRVVFSRIQRLESLSKKRIEGNLAWVPIEGLLKQIREIKEVKEVDRLRISAQFAVEALQFVIGELKEGSKEREMEQKLRLYCSEYNGVLGFEPIIAFGENSSRPHGRPTDRELKMGDIVQIDLGIKVNNYHSDISRIHFFGEPNPKLLEINEIVKSAQKAALKLCRPTTPIVELEHIARQHIEEAGYGEYFPHSLGHGVGLEVHENPTIRRTSDDKLVLKEGMVITIEPGIYVPGLGGIRIEDTILITHDGYSSLTEGAPKC